MKDVDVQLFQRLVDASVIGVVVWELVDPTECESLALVYANPRAMEILRTELGGQRGKRIRELLPTVDRARCDLYANVVRTTQPWEGVVASGAGGAGRSYRVRAVALGTNVGIFFEDVTRDRDIEEATRRLNRFLDSILEALPVMVFVKDAAELRFERINRAGEELIGVRRDALIGKNDYDFFPKEQADFFTGEDRKTLAAEAPVEIPAEPIETPKGRRWLNTRKVAVRDEDGAPRHLLGISVDITERLAADEALRAAKAATDAANRELEAFAHSVAHDLRAPLRAIDGFSQALFEDHGSKLDASGLEQLRRIRAATARTGRIIDDLLELSRVTRREARIEEVDLGEVAREVVAELAAANAQRTIVFDVVPSASARGDRGLLRVALENLLANAVKFTSKNERARVRFGVETRDGERAFFVEDDGVGFDMQYAKKLFGPFERLHSAREFEGTGIGLATVSRIVARHGGRIGAESEPGRGAKFWFTLP
ncbi:MAG TPA: PAS domain-containing protein [Labilithrix sp.]